MKLDLLLVSFVSTSKLLLLYFLSVDSGSTISDSNLDSELLTMNADMEGI